VILGCALVVTPSQDPVLGATTRGTEWAPMGGFPVAIRRAGMDVAHSGQGTLTRVRSRVPCRQGAAAPGAVSPRTLVSTIAATSAAVAGAWSGVKLVGPRVTDTA